ncbi:MAG: three-Cys-motif partner protein TcmP [Chromatiales bacterium]
MDDGLATPEVGAWAEEKYRLVQGYARVFATSMKHKWKRVYVDLFAGSGRSRIERTNRIVLASPLLALEIPDRFDRYIFCESDGDNVDALRKRIANGYADADVRVLYGDANQLVNEVLAAFPLHSSTNKVLAFCFADPYKLKNLKFSTIRGLATRFVDFLVLIPTEMDAHRNVGRYYCNPENTTVDDFVGTAGWRTEWEKAESRGEPFWGFLTHFYAERMRQLEYLEHSAQEAQLIRSTEKNLPLYRLDLF